MEKLKNIQVTKKMISAKGKVQKESASSQHLRTQKHKTVSKNIKTREKD